MPSSSTLLLLASAVVAGGLVGAVLPWLRRPGRSVGSSPTTGRLLAEHVVDMVSTHDTAGVFRYVSPVLAGLVGEYPGLLVGTDPGGIAHRDDAAAVAALWRRTIAARGAPVTVTWRCRRHSGEYVWLETTARLATGDAAALGDIVCASRDVTERQRIEDALRESEQRFRGTLEAVRLVALGLDAEGRVTFANDALCALTGWTRTELLGELWFEKCALPGDAFRAAFLRTVTEGTMPPTVENEVVCRDGTRRTIAWENTVLRSTTGAVQGAASLGADVTARRLEEDTVRLLQSILHGISTAADLDTALAETLASLCRATGWRYAEAWLPTADGARLERTTHYSAPGSVTAPLVDAGTGLTFAPGEGLPGRVWRSRTTEAFHELGRADATAFAHARPAEACGFRAALAVPVASGADVVAVLVFFREQRPVADDRHASMIAVVAAQVGALIDRRRAQTRYEAELRAARGRAEAANRAKSEFLSRMSHELRTPLNSVIGFANVLRKNREDRLTAQELEYLDRITQNGQHLLSLVNDVLDIAKVEAGRLTVSKSAVHVDGLLREVVAQLEGQPRASSVELRVEVPGDITPIEADGALVRQVLINLTSNALRFTREGSVVLSTDVDEERRPTRIHVRDTGIGIPADRLAAIFEPFEQADATTHQTYGGTGLGLAISKSICDALGYSLAVESEVGRGSRFTIGLTSPGRAHP